MTKQRSKSASTNKQSSALAKVNLFIGLLIFISVAFIVWDKVGSKSGETQIRVVNTQEIAKAQLVAVDELMKKDNNFDANRVELEATKFAQRFVKVIDRYRSQGYIVISATEPLVAWPGSIDITNNVAASLGLKVAYTPSSLTEQMIAKNNKNMDVN